MIMLPSTTSPKTRTALAGCAAALALLFTAGTRIADAQLSGGQEWVVNSFFTGEQQYPDVAAIAGGTYVVVWESQDEDGSGEGVYGKLLDATGFPAGTEFRVNTATLGSQDKPSVASTASGNFVVVWEASNHQDGDREGVFGQRYASSGAKLGTEFGVNTTTVNIQDQPDIAANASGGFVVVWESSSQDGNNTGVFGQRFSSNGAKAGTEFQVNTTTIGPQAEPAVGMDDAGNFVVVWTSTLTVGGNPPHDERTRADIFAQRFTSSGARAGTEFMVNTYTTQNQDEAAVAVDADGDFIIAWESGANLSLEAGDPGTSPPTGPLFGQDGDTNGIFAQRFTSAGAPVGAEFQVNVYTTYSQDDVSIASTPDGGFVVAWESFTQDGDELGVFLRRYNAAGAPLGGDTQVNVTTSADQEQVAIAVAANGDFVVASEGYEQDSSYDAIVARRFTTIQGGTTTTLGATTTTVGGGTTTTTITTPGGICDVVPATSCVTGAAEKSVLSLTIKGGDGDKFKWKLGNGAATALTDFLDPLGNALAGYHVCLYDGDGMFFESVVPSQGTCSGKPCWKTAGKSGFKYNDRDALAGGVQQMKLKSGDAGKSQVQAKGKGAALAFPLGPYALPVTAQLIADDGTSSACWQTTFTLTKKNTLNGFKAKGP